MAERLLEDATKETVHRDRELAAHYRWRAARLAPQTYGDRVQVGGTVHHVQEVRDYRPEWLAGRLAHVKAPLLIEHDDDQDDDGDDWA